MGSVLKLKIFEITTTKKIELCLLGVIVAIALSIGISLCGRIIIDDAYITYRYARNLAEGLGFVYNPGERVFSTTTPLYTLVLVASYFFSKDLATNSYLFSVLSLVSCIILIYMIFAREKIGVVGLMASFLIAINSLIILTFGMETCFYLLLLLLSIYFYLDNKLILTAFFLGLSVLTRIDGFIMVGTLAIHYIIVNFKSIKNLTTIKKLFRPLLIFIVTITPWFLFSIAYFGQLFPNTLNVKMAQLQSHLCWQFSFTHDFLKVILDQYLYFIALFIFGVILIVLKYRKLSVLLVYFLVYLISYSKLPYYHWYVAPPLTVFLIVSSIGFYFIIKLILSGLEKEVATSSVFNSKYAKILVILPLILMFIVSASPIMENTNNLLMSAPTLESNLDNRMNFYKYIGEEIKNETNEDNTIGAAEIGIFGYYSERRILDFCGLLQPFIAENLGSKRIIETYKPDLIVYSPIFGVFPENLLYYYKIKECHVIQNEKWFILEYTNDSSSLITRFTNIETNLPPQYCTVNVLDIRNIHKISFFEHPLTNKKAYVFFNNITIPKNATLKFGIALDPQVWSPDKGDGVLFEICIKENESEHKIFSKYIDPKNNPEDRKWNDFEIDLSEFSNKSVTITFATSPGPKNNNAFDWAWWGEPIIMGE